MKNSLLVVCEGLDGAGKTTVIKNALKKLDEKYVYRKALGSNTFIGKIVKRFPSTLTFLLELAYISNKNLEGKVILQDRYDLSVLSYVPAVDRCYNKFIIKLFSPFIKKPDVFVYFTVSLDERINRLKNTEYNWYHNMLIKNLELITLRERKYLELYNQFNGKKFILDTTNESIEDTINDFIDILKS